AAVCSAVRPDVVFHLAAVGARPGERDAERMRQVNVDGTWHLWHAAPAAARFVMTGTCGEYGRHDGPSRETDPCRPLSAYAATKHAAVTLVTALARESGRPAVVLRPYGPYGPGDDPGRVIPHAIAGLLRGETVPLTSGRQRRDFSFVSDHVEAMVRAATAAGLEPGAIFNVASGRTVVLREALEAVAAIVGGPGRLDFGALPDRPGDVPDMTADVSEARARLGFVAEVPFESGIRATAAWVASRLAEGGR
ncbi:MAG: NAD-dependent epimerase/dehydratase family protein, partial [Vicinamibacterales bacterium]